MIKQIISIDTKSAKPKYRQIIDSVSSAIVRGVVRKGEKMPSINQICGRYKVSRDTVMFAFNTLKARGIILSQPGKGYYIASTDIHPEEKVFVMFDELNSFKEDLYNSLVNTIKEKASFEIFFHHFNYKVFKNLILESIGYYTSYIIMPANFNNTCGLLNKLPRGKVFIVDRLKPDLNEFPAVFQDFEQDVYDALNDGISLIKKYRKLVFVNPGGKEPVERVNGFERFCRENNYNFETLKNLDSARPGLYEAWFLISDRDLVHLLKIIKEYKYKLGKKFGIVSFNDTLLKQMLAGGITTISTDFTQMGITLGDMLMYNRSDKVRNPSKLIVRNSL
jgi:DNA-binding transcriptional regulator YhcF (GntR family)